MLVRLRASLLVRLTQPLASYVMLLSPRFTRTPVGSRFHCTSILKCDYMTCTCS